MTKRYNVTALCIFGYLLIPVQTTNAATDVLQQIKRNYAKNASIFCEFEQSIYWNVREKTTKSTGSIALDSGDQFRVILGSELYVCDGSTCWHYNRNTNQVNIRNLKDLDRSVHPSFLLNSFLNQCAFVEKHRTKQQVTLIAESDSTTKAEYTAVEITVQVPSGTVTTLKFNDKNGNIHTYRFRKTVFKKQHSPNHFKFEAPPDADIIDHRH